MPTTPTPLSPVEFNVPNDPVLDRLYGTPDVEPRAQKAPPISRSLQFVDDFAFTPEVPESLQPQAAPPAPTPTPAPPAPIQQSLTIDPPAPAPPVVQAPNPTPEPPKEYTATVDLGDGSGPQIFKADSQNGLIEKLVNAQKHATLKIRELAQKAKAKPDKETPIAPLAVQPKSLTEQELAEINELAKTNLVAAWRRLYEAETGTKPAEVARAVSESQRAAIHRAAQEAEVSFIADHQEDFDCSPSSGEKIYSFLAGCTRPVTTGGYQCPRCNKVHDPSFSVTRNNLEYAFETLTEQGVTFMNKPVSQPAPTPTPVVQAQPVAPAPAPPTQYIPEPAPVAAPAPVPQVSSPPPPVMLSDRSGQRSEPAPDATQGVNVAELTSLPVHEMRARIASIMKKGAVPSR